MGDGDKAQSFNNIGGGSSSTRRKNEDKPKTTRRKLQTRGANLTKKQIEAAQKLIGRSIYMERNGAEVHGTVTFFYSRMNRLKVVFEDKRVEYLSPDEVVSILRIANPEDKKIKKYYGTPNYNPQQFMGLIICKEFDGIKCLGTVVSFSLERKKMLEVLYRAENRTEYMDQIEALTNIAKLEDMLAVADQQASNESTSSKNAIDKKKKSADLEEGSSATKRKRTTPSGRQ